MNFMGLGSVETGEKSVDFRIIYEDTPGGKSKIRK